MGRALSLTTSGPDRRDGRLHEKAAGRLAALDQRYTPSRRVLVQTLEEAAHPLTIAEIVGRADGVPQSSAYRNLTVLIEAGIAIRLPGADDYGRFELAEDLAGHHHHLVCVSCGAVADHVAGSRLERALREAAQQAAEDSGFEVTGHRLDFEGRCRRCGDTDRAATLAEGESSRNGGGSSAGLMHPEERLASMRSTARGERRGRR